MTPIDYTTFSLPELPQRFNLVLHYDTDLFASIPPVSLPAGLASLLEEPVPLALAIDTEKARSEFIIAPILAEYRKHFKHSMSLFSGVEFNVDAQQGLNGICAFIISRSSQQWYVTAPVIVLVEAKNNRLKDGFPQCIAEMLAAQRFNEQQGQPLPAIYGVVTTGSLWRFLKLAGLEVWIDLAEYHVREIEKIFAVLIAMGGVEGTG